MVNIRKWPDSPDKREERLPRPLLIELTRPLDQRDADDSKCAICFDIAFDPVDCGAPSGCSVLFCCCCFEDFLNSIPDERKSTHANCPACRFKTTTARRAVREKNRLERCEVRCAYPLDSPGLEGVVVGAKCQWQGELGSLQGHISACPFVEVVCEHEGCGAKVLRGDQAAHQAECSHRLLACDLCSEPVPQHALEGHIADQCPQALVPCSSDCGAIVARGSLTQHGAECPNTIVPCTHAELGCSVRVARRDLATHCHEAVVSHNRLLCKLALQTAKTAASALATSSASCIEWRLDGVAGHLRQATEAASGAFKVHSGFFEVSLPTLVSSAASASVAAAAVAQPRRARIYIVAKFRKDKAFAVYLRQMVPPVAAAFPAVDVSGWGLGLRGCPSVLTFNEGGAASRLSPVRNVGGMVVGDATAFVAGDALVVQVRTGSCVAGLSTHTAYQSPV